MRWPLPSTINPASRRGSSAVSPSAPGLPIAGQLHLNELPQLGIDDLVVLARVNVALVPDLAAVDRNLQQSIERAAQEAVACPPGRHTPHHGLSPDDGAFPV